MILVTGATGNIGSEVVRLLVSSGAGVRVLTRDPAKAEKLGRGIEVAVGDLTQRQSLEAAFVGIKKAFVLVPTGETQAAVADTTFDVAKKAGTRHVVFVSSGTITMNPPVAIGRWHLAAEERLKVSGLAWTMLRPDNFASNALRWAGSIRAKGMVFQLGAAGKSMPIDPRDIAAVAAKALTTDGHEGKTYDLTGPEVLTAAQQVELLGAALGKTLRCVDAAEADVRTGMLRSGMPAPMVEAVLEIVRRPVGSPHGERPSSAVRDVTGNEARSFAAWARDHVHAFA